MKRLLSLLILAIPALFSFEAMAQTDSLILKNNNVVVGDLKKMDRGVITIETAYSKDDFKVKWTGLKRIYTTQFYVITLLDGTRLSGKLESVDENIVNVRNAEGASQSVKMQDVVSLQKLEKGFWDRAKANIDFGFGSTKAHNYKNVSLRSNIGYLAEKWSAGAYYNILYSSQTDVAPIRSTDGGMNYNYLLPKDWYIPASVSLLSNTEQKIDLRTLAKLGIGNYVIHTNVSYWGFAGGATYNKEDYTEAPGRKSWEGFIGTELNLYDIGDLNLLSKLVAYPSFTESGRWRADFLFDTKYDLPLDFYISYGITIYYDNRPVEGAPTTDYSMQFGIGWEL